jgi:hypothetical protein
MRESFLETRYSACTPDDYQAGRHLRWEVEAHLAAKKFLETHGFVWSDEQRRAWVDEYLISHNWSETMRVVSCPICSEVIAKAVLEGRDPWQVPARVKEAVRQLAARFSPIARKQIIKEGKLLTDQHGHYRTPKVATTSQDVIRDLETDST